MVPSTAVQWVFCLQVCSYQSYAASRLWRVSIDSLQQNPKHKQVTNFWLQCVFCGFKVCSHLSSAKGPTETKDIFWIFFDTFCPKKFWSFSWTPINHLRWRDQKVKRYTGIVAQWEWVSSWYYQPHRATLIVARAHILSWPRVMCSQVRML